MISNDAARPGSRQFAFLSPRATCERMSPAWQGTTALHPEDVEQALQAVQHPRIEEARAGRYRIPAGG